MLKDPEHTRYLSLNIPATLSDVETMTDLMLSDPKNCLWTIRQQSDESFAGMCGFLNDSETPNFIYSILEALKGLGYATEACEKAIPAGVKLFEFSEVELNIHEANFASHRIAEKLGFQKHHTYQHKYPRDPEPVGVWAWRKSF